MHTNTNIFSKQESNLFPLSLDIKFYSIADVQEMTKWSEATVQKLFNDPKFPAANYGRNKLVEAHALIKFFAERHDKEKEAYWK